jgi:type IV pilus assembly protein PilX
VEIGAMMNRVRLPSRQRGTFVFMALIVLVVIMIASAGLMRSVGSGVFLSGNMAFRQAATFGADAGIEAARNLLITRGGQTGSDVIATDTAYYSSTSAAFSPTTFNWGLAFKVNNGVPDPAGNVVHYVIHRLCLRDGVLFSPNDTATGQQCATGEGAGGGLSTATAMQYGNGALVGPGARYFRVTVRVVGPRSTVSFVQATLSLSDMEKL